MKLSKESKIGLIVLLGIALLFWGVNFLKGKDFFSSDRQVFAIYSHVEGLSPSNPVMVNGLKIGLIRKLKLMDDNSGRILVSMNITGKVPIPKNSVAQIFSVDILGSKGIRVLLGDDKEELQDGDTLKTSIQKSLQDEVSAQVAPIRAKAESLLSSMDSVLVIIRDVFNDKTKNNLRNSFESISHSLASVEGIAGALDTVLSREGRLRNIFVNLESISANMKDNNEKITTMIENFSAISDTLAKSNLSRTLLQMQRTLEQTATTLDRINKGQGTLGQLANNDSLYINLNNSARDLDLLLNDFRRNPGRYVKFSVVSFGSKKSK